MLAPSWFHFRIIFMFLSDWLLNYFWDCMFTKKFLHVHQQCNSKTPQRVFLKIPWLILVPFGLDVGCFWYDCVHAGHFRVPFCFRLGCFQELVPHRKGANVWEHISNPHGEVFSISLPFQQHRAFRRAGTQITGTWILAPTVKNVPDCWSICARSSPQTKTRAIPNTSQNRTWRNAEWN